MCSHGNILTDESPVHSVDNNIHSDQYTTPTSVKLSSTIDFLEQKDEVDSVESEKLDDDKVKEIGEKENEIHSETGSNEPIVLEKLDVPVEPLFETGHSDQPEEKERGSEDRIEKANNIMFQSQHENQTESDDKPQQHLSVVEDIDPTKSNIPDIIKESNDIHKLPTIEVPNTIEQSSNVEVPNTIEQSSNVEVPNTIEQSSNVEVPNTVEQSSNVEVPNTIEQSSNVEVPSTIEQSSNVEVPNTIEQSSNVEVPRTIEQSSNVEVPNTIVQSSNVEVPSTIEQSSNVEVPSTIEQSVEVSGTEQSVDVPSTIEQSVGVLNTNQSVNVLNTEQFVQVPNTNEQSNDAQIPSYTEQSIEVPSNTEQSEESSTEQSEVSNTEQPNIEVSNTEQSEQSSNELPVNTVILDNTSKLDNDNKQFNNTKVPHPGDNDTTVNKSLSPVVEEKSANTEDENVTIKEEEVDDIVTFEEFKSRKSQETAATKQQPPQGKIRHGAYFNTSYIYFHWS